MPMPLLKRERQQRKWLGSQCVLRGAASEEAHGRTSYRVYGVATSLCGRIQRMPVEAMELLKGLFGHFYFSLFSLSISLVWS